MFRRRYRSYRPRTYGRRSYGRRTTYGRRSYGRRSFGARGYPRSSGQARRYQPAARRYYYGGRTF